MSTLLTFKCWVYSSIDINCRVKVLKKRCFHKFRKDNIVKQLETCAYGLHNVSCTWLLRVHDALIKLGATSLPHSPELFY